MKFPHLFSLFNRSNPTDQTHIKHLIEMAVADGHLDKRENDLLLKIAKKNKLSKAEIDHLKEAEGLSELQIPVDEYEKFQQFYDLVQMMMADDRIHSEEWKLCQSFGKKLGYSWSKLDELIYLVSEYIAKGKNTRDTMNEVESMLK